MNSMSFRHLDYVTPIGMSRLRLTKPNSKPVSFYHLEYDQLSSPGDVTKKILDVYGQSVVGRCFEFTMSALYLLNDQRYVPYRSKDDSGTYHWWFQNEVNGSIYDISQDQYSPDQLERLWSNGEPRPFYTWYQMPTVRSMDLIEELQQDSCRRYTTYEPLVS